jgi:hypothetical protein
MRATQPLTAGAVYPPLSYRLSVIVACLLAGVLVHFAFADYDQVMHGPPANAALLIDLLSAPPMIITA